MSVLKNYDVTQDIYPSAFIRYRDPFNSRLCHGRILEVNGPSLAVEVRESSGKFSKVYISASMILEVVPWFERFSHRESYFPYIKFGESGYEVINKVRLFLEANILREPVDMPLACRYFLERSRQSMTPAGTRKSFVHFGFNLVLTIDTKSKKLIDVCFLDENKSALYPLSYFEYKSRVGAITKHALDRLNTRKFVESQSISKYISRALAHAEEVTDYSLVDLEARIKGLRFFKNENYDLVLVMNRELDNIITVYPYRGSKVESSEVKQGA